MIDAETLNALRDFRPCLQSGTAIVDRRALEAAITHLAKEMRSPPNSVVIHHIEPCREPAFVAVMDGGRCRHCGAPR